MASLHHPQLLAMGEPVMVKLPGVTATVTALGPTQTSLTAPTPGADVSTTGIITVDVVPTSGSIRLGAADFRSRDETGRIVSLDAAGSTSVVATVAHPAHVRIEGRYRSGAAEVTWRYHGSVLAIWDFTIELD